jgi:hypothetical protein
MEKHEEVKTILGIALLYTIVTSILSFLSRLNAFLMQDGFEKATNLFLQRNALWIIVVTGVIIILSVYTKKLKQKFYSDVLQNRIIRLTTGVLIALEGLINLSSILPICIMSVNLSIQVSQQAGESMEGIITKSIMSNAISVIIIIFQILIGIYLVKFYEKKTN